MHGEETRAAKTRFGLMASTTTAQSTSRIVVVVVVVVAIAVAVRVEENSPLADI
jgi:hypothetical protein